MTILLLLVGLGLIVLGADWLVDGASAITTIFSQKFNTSIKWKSISRGSIQERTSQYQQ